jgi:hypothetical protein
MPFWFEARPWMGLDGCVKLDWMNDESDRQRIEAAVSAMLPASKRPWDVAVSRNRHGGGWVVELNHEASHGLILDMGASGANADEMIAKAADWLIDRKSELDRIAAAPLLSNADSVMEIRALASIFNWSKFEVSAVVRFVERWALTADEAEWLISAIGHDGPKPPSSWDF